MKKRGVWNSKSKMFLHPWMYLHSYDKAPEILTFLATWLTFSANKALQHTSAHEFQEDMIRMIYRIISFTYAVDWKKTKEQETRKRPLATSEESVPTAKQPRYWPRPSDSHLARA